MEQREPPKSRLKSEMESDRISNLPSDVIEQILSHLPMREAVRTSVLSSNWRYKWAMLRHLVFDDRCVSTQKHITFVDIVDHVLLGHIGPIHKFRLSHRGRPANWDIDFWILHLSRNSIKELILEIWGEYHYRIPSYLFSCQNMIHLELLRCVLKPPPTFKGFRNLKSLVISHVILGQDVFQSLIACCPLLERLTLIEFDFAHLKIDAPNLQFLVVEGDFWDLIFENTLNLIDVCVSMDTDVGQIWGCDSSSNLVKFMVHLPHIQRLQIQGFFLKVNPAFEELELSGDQERQAALSEVNSLYGNWICPFSQLRFVKISNVSNVKAQLDFIRFLLLNSPVLEKIIVKPAYADDSWEQVKQLLRLGRASVHSEIIFLDPSFELWQLR
ncbi:F-box/FBD/LRR-repeat protein At1g13570-like isoform X2 [Prunus dulcis]|uniref:F-box/FBD/LRR-repeat protein At1g13570-like isoform X2 n=1 Tax=Prunus dulcis TaxID=3755 RepID=UPI001483BFD2|nr:F-box/FBD/LRR-repeat protein At1g13570-like isoform X2 [Prunus dulcis]